MPGCAWADGGAGGRLFSGDSGEFYHTGMAFPIRKCSICGEEFELKPDKPGFANRCPACSEPEETAGQQAIAGAGQFGNDREANAERRRVMREMLYKKES